MKSRLVLVMTLIVAVVVVVASWATDFVTLQGEWTIYTADCVGGSWTATACSGKLQPADRFRFRALKAHREVLFWTAGDAGESGRFRRCTIEDGKNWLCPVDPELSRTITHQMAQGSPVWAVDAGALPFHRVPKWKWVALTYGLPVGRQALN